jgi:hypothetical protein
MPPNHQVPIEQADLWDVLDWEQTCELAKDAIGDPRDDGGKNALAWTAKMLIDYAATTDGSDLRFFHRIATTYVTASNDAERRRQASGLADLFGANAERLIAFLAFKWGLFKRTASKASSRRG